MKPKGLFAMVGGGRPSPAAAEDDDDLDDYAEDLEMSDPEDEAQIGAGPFDAYAETVFDVDADPAARTDALREAILTVLEERGR
jgi:hypothetical protein